MEMFLLLPLYNLSLIFHQIKGECSAICSNLFLTESKKIFSQTFSFSFIPLIGFGIVGNDTRMKFEFIFHFRLPDLALYDFLVLSSSSLSDNGFIVPLS